MITDGRSVFALDIDGVACDHAEAVCRYVTGKYGIKCHPDEVTSRDHDFGGITFSQVVDETYPDPDFILRMKVTDGFSSFLPELANQFRVVFFTTRKSYCHGATKEWVRRNFGDQEVFFVGKKDDIPAAFLLDDNIEEALRFAENGGTAFLFRRPWNDNCSTASRLRGQERCYSVSSFAEVLKILKS